MSLKAQPYIFRRFFVMQYLSICRLRPIFNSSKFIRMQEMGLIFEKFPGGACPRTSLASLHACGACLLRACGARSFAAVPLLNMLLPKTRPIENCFRRACCLKYFEWQLIHMHIKLQSYVNISKTVKDKSTLLFLFVKSQ